ncbi:hypothetical protein QYE76_068431 [Lolium multiflorum]|uniref:Uncharacterized protein n=1 Tax=Lolium multiflorum TaxID=4521 RepID=A0AAD8WBQ3_LOLMU|nr:hypothetical protein QYE76_068431 [Lolium multiflorum]
MAAKVQETENKKASKARNREGERGQWWPCETTDSELRELQSEGMISAYWSFIRDTVVPKPGAGEVLATLAEENLRTILRVPVSGAEEVPEDEEEEEEPAPRKDSDYHRHSDRQPKTHHGIHEEISGCRSSHPSSAKCFPHCSPVVPSSISPPRRKHSTGDNSGQREKVGGEDPKAKGPAQEETQDQGEAEVTSSEKVGAGAGDVVVFPKNFGDPTDLTSTPKAYATKIFKQLTEPEKWELEQDLLNAMLNNAWEAGRGTSEIQDFKKSVGEFLDKLICKQKVLPSSPQACASSPGYDLLRAGKPALPYQELEIKLKEAEQQNERAETTGGENSELIREKGEFVLKRNADSETIKRLQKELNGLRKYMETAEHHWDLLAENILEPLGYPEKRRTNSPDDVLSLAAMTAKILYPLLGRCAITCP